MLDFNTTLAHFAGLEANAKSLMNHPSLTSGIKNRNLINFLDNLPYL